jgi:small-conductance mechanosensitive channel
VEFLEELGEAISPEGVSLADLLLAVVLVATALPVSRFVERIARALVRRLPKVSTEAAAVIAYGSRYLTLFLLASMALNLLGVNIGWALALAVLFLIVVVLTLRPLVQNGAAGFLLKTRPAFAVGDEVQVSDFRGEVLSISARTTVLRTRDGKRIHIPNTDVLDNEIIVFTAFRARRLSVDLRIDQRSDLDRVSEVLTAAVGALPIAKAQPPPKVIATSLVDGAVGLSVQFWFEPQALGEQAAVDAATRAVHAALRNAGIELLPPRLQIDAPEVARHQKRSVGNPEPG